MTDKLAIDDLIENPQMYGFIKIHCDKCGQDNYYAPDIANTITQCFGCTPVGGLPE